MYYSVILFAFTHFKMLITVVAKLTVWECAIACIHIHKCVRFLSNFFELQPNTDLRLLFIVKENTLKSNSHLTVQWAMQN